MLGNEPDRQPSSLRGWLSDIYFPALLDGQLGPFCARLGARATVDEPLFGRAVGLPALEALLQQVVEWTKKTSAKYERGLFTTGTDRDVTEGMLTLTTSGKTLELPVAVVAERRRSREVEVRIYYAASIVRGKPLARGSLLPHSAELLLPPPVDTYVDAMTKGVLDKIMASFESAATLVDSCGKVWSHADGTLRAYHEKIIAGGWSAQRGGAADDGRTCALEYSLTKIAGASISPQAGLMVCEKGDSGLLHAIRIYDDVVI